MTSNPATRVERHLAVITASTAAVACFTQDARAVIVYTPNANISIPANSSGVYLNIVNGTMSSSAASVPGWDVNPWGSSSLDMFSPTNPANGVYVGSGTQYANLAPGTLVSILSTFASASSATPDASLNLNANTNLIGFRFYNESGGTYHYGWMRLSLGSTLAASRSIVEYAWETSGGIVVSDEPTGIRAGEIPTPAAAFPLTLGAFAVMCSRRRTNLHA